jgi:dihydroxyacetone kinase-like predicted kinase
VITARSCAASPRARREARFSGLDLANALTLGTQTAYGAVGKPVEGDDPDGHPRVRRPRPSRLPSRDDAMEVVLAATVEGRGGSVAKTPSLLPILREAGVVDSGGQGLFRLFEGALLSVQGKRSMPASARPATVHAEERHPVAPAFRAGVAALEEGRVRIRDGIHPHRDAGHET